MSPNNYFSVHGKITIAIVSHKIVIPQINLYNPGFMLYSNRTQSSALPSILTSHTTWITIHYLLMDLVYLLPQEAASVVLLPDRGIRTYMCTTLLTSAKIFVYTGMFKRAH